MMGAGRTQVTSGVADCALRALYFRLTGCGHPYEFFWIKRIAAHGDQPASPLQVTDSNDLIGLFLDDLPT